MEKVFCVLLFFVVTFETISCHDPPIAIPIAQPLPDDVAPVTLVRREDTQVRTYHKCPPPSQPRNKEIIDIVNQLNLQTKILKKYQVQPKYYGLLCFVKTTGFYINKQNVKENYAQYALQIKLDDDKFAHVLLDNVTPLNVMNDEVTIVYNGFDKKATDPFWM